MLCSRCSGVSPSTASRNVCSVLWKQRSDRRQEQLALGPEQPEQVGLGDAGAPGDVVGGGAVQALQAELDHGRVEHGVAALVGGLAGGGGGHAD